MKQTMLHTVKYLFAAALICCITASCGDDSHIQTPDQTENTESSATTEAKEIIPYSFAQSELDFGGYNFRIFSHRPEDVDVLKEDLVAGDIDIAVTTVEKRDAHGDRADIEVFLTYHSYCFKYISGIKHIRSCAWC